MLTRIRKLIFLNAFFSLGVVSLFLLSKSKFSTPKKPLSAKAALHGSVAPYISQALHAPEQEQEQEPELAPAPKEQKMQSQRIFNYQLNRHPRTVSVKPKKRQNPVQVALLNQMAEQGFLEPPQGAPFNLDPYESEITLDPLFSLAASIPREIALTIQEGLVVASNTQAIWDSVGAFPAVPDLAAEFKPKEVEPVHVSKEPAKPAPTLAVETVEPGETASVSMGTQAEAVLDSQPESQPLEGEAGMRNQSLKPLQAAPAELGPVLEGGKNILQSIQKTFISGGKNPPSKMTIQSNKNPNQNVVRGGEYPERKHRRNSAEPIGSVYGRLTLDSPVQEWIEEAQGHIELKLQKKNSRDPQDQFFLEYQYPEKEFSWDGRAVAGSYQLVASFFKPNKAVPSAEVAYSTEINEETAKRRLIFHIRKPDLDEAMSSVAAKSQTGAILSGTVFEASTADHTSEKTIPAAEVEVVGFSHLGLFRTDREGTFRISNIPAHSEFLIRVKAEGYYPTEVIVPVFQAAGYVSVHLVSRSTVDTVTRYFTKKPQSAHKALMMGRVFDSETRAPQSDQEMALLGRSNSAVYFNAFPDLNLRKTSGTGSFAYFNVDPAFRSVGRLGSSAFHLMQTKPGSAYYVESGRGGSRALQGKLLDPYRQQRVLGLVKIVGSSTQVETNENGEFEITGIDLPPGVITFEVEAEGYPKSWHTVPWSTREAHPSYTFYLPEAELLEEARSSVARLRDFPHRGTLLGGAQTKFFEKNRQCIYVTLENFKGETVSKEQGPYPLHVSQRDLSKPLCLTAGRPGFAFYHLEPGEYLLKWKTKRGEILRTHVTRVGSDRTSVLIN